MNQKVDRFGAVASSLCAAHCAVCALLPAAFSALGLGFLMGHEAEWAFVLLAVALGAGAMVLGWRQHRSTKVAGLLALGIIGLLVSRGLEMSGDHHGHHDEVHHAEAADGDGHEREAESKSDEHGDEKEEEHAQTTLEHSEDSHLLGASVGIFSGLLLMFGHILNIRTLRRCEMPCCP